MSERIWGFVVKCAIQIDAYFTLLYTLVLYQNSWTHLADFCHILDCVIKNLGISRNKCTSCAVLSQKTLPVFWLFRHKRSWTIFIYNMSIATWSIAVYMAVEPLIMTHAKQCRQPKQRGCCKSRCCWRVICLLCIITHTGIVTGMGRAFSRICLSVCLSVCPRSKKKKAWAISTKLWTHTV